MLKTAINKQACTLLRFTIVRSVIYNTHEGKIKSLTSENMDEIKPKEK